MWSINIVWISQKKIVLTEETQHSKAAIRLAWTRNTPTRSHWSGIPRTKLTTCFMTQLATWAETPHTCEPGNALFPESEKLNGPVKIGAPHFVDFGKNMKHSPDGKAYLIGHGSEESDLEDRKANLSWITGDQIYICRVEPTPQNINDESKYEYFAGHDESGNALWSLDYSAIKPLIDWDNNCGCVTMTYNAPLRKYLMCVTDGWPTVKTMNTYIL